VEESPPHLLEVGLVHFLAEESPAHFLVEEEREEASPQTVMQVQGL